MIIEKSLPQKNRFFPFNNYSIQEIENISDLITKQGTDPDQRWTERTKHVSSDVLRSEHTLAEIFIHSFFRIHAIAEHNKLDSARVYRVIGCSGICEGGKTDVQSAIERWGGAICGLSQ